MKLWLTLKIQNYLSNNQNNGIKIRFPLQNPQNLMNTNYHIKSIKFKIFAFQY